MVQKRPAIGQHYRNLDVSWNSVWVIEAIYKGMDAIEYALLRSDSDRTHCKTLSLSVITDPTRFVPLQQADRLHNNG